MIHQPHKFNTIFAVAAFLWAGFGLTTPTHAQTSDGPPHIVSTSPKIGATDVEPSLKEITVTFDKDMEEGMSWTGGGSQMPKSPADAQAFWRDKRTCVLPVKLQPGHYYRVGINSMSYHGFCGVNGVPVSPSAISFRTTGTAVKSKAPKILKISPANGAIDVSPSVTEISVTFDVPMSSDMSWCGGGPNFPDSPPGKKPHWSKDATTCVLPVQLKPNWQYELGINCQSYRAFKSDEGVALTPVDYSFKTSDKP
jgi:RNA polymerase sigma-70 factor (ECF subfamily)